MGFQSGDSGMADFGSNIPTKQDPETRRIILKKDGKDICHVKCDSHIELPLSWNITRFVPQTAFEKLALSSHVYIYPTPITTHQEREWRTFSSFLQDNVKVAIVRSEQYCFCILPPDRHANLDCAKVAYTVEEVLDSCGNKKHALSANGDTMAQIMSIVPLEASLHNKPKRVHVTRPNPNLASIHPSFLENLGRAHAWIFGAIAELVDNSRDAKASRLHIFIDNLYYSKAEIDIPVLSIIDDGCGMTHDEIRKMVSFGRKKPDNDDFDRIGRFGTGFKTGVMRLGRDALVLTQTAQSRSIAFLSQSLNEGKDNVEIPLISYRRCKQSTVLDTSVLSESLAELNMKEIKGVFSI